MLLTLGHRFSNLYHFVTNYNILKYPWHTAHDYELAKIPHKFFYLCDTPRNWAANYRPLPQNITWVGSSKEASADVMVLHLDQWSLHESAKRFLFLTRKDNFAGPKIVIIHGCNMLDGCSSEQMRELVSGCFVVCNSKTALELWDLPNSRFIFHGFSPQEWPATNYTLNNIVVCLPHNFRHPECINLNGIRRVEEQLPITWIGRDISFKSFVGYRNFLSQSAIFFNPSYASANPRARAEAMLMGLAVVTTDSHGESEYIQNTVNGFCSNNFDELIEFLSYLKSNPDQVKKIGQKGRETAAKVFNIDNFVNAWNDLLKDSVG